MQAGVKQHPDSVLLHMSAGGLEMMDTGMNVIFGARLPTGARRHLETALKLAEASTDPKVTALLPMIRERLSLLDEVQQAMGHFGSPFGGMPFGPGPGPDFYDMFDDDFDDEDDFDDDEDEPFTLDFGPPPSRGRRQGPQTPKGSRRKKK